MNKYQISLYTMSYKHSTIGTFDNIQYFITQSDNAFYLTIIKAF